MRTKIRMLRISKGVSQSFISKQLGYKNASGYGNIEMGRSRLALEDAAKIASILNVSMDELLED